MVAKSLIRPEKRRIMRPPFAWIDRRFLFDGFLARLSAQENLLYFFLVLVSDRHGLSYYSYEKICQRLKLDGDDYIQARNGLIQKELIAFDGRHYQVLALPTPSSLPQGKPRADEQKQAQSLAEIFSALAQAR